MCVTSTLLSALVGLAVVLLVGANVVVQEVGPDYRAHFVDYGNSASSADTVLTELDNGIHSKSHIIDIGHGLEHEDVIDVSFGVEPAHPEEQPLVRPYIPAFPGYVHEEEEREELDVVLPRPPIHGHNCRGHGVCRFVNHDVCLCHCEPGYISDANVCVVEHCPAEDYHCQEKLALRRALNAELVTTHCAAGEAFRGVDGICHSTSGLAGLDVIVGQHLLPSHHSVLHSTRAHSFAACEKDCALDARCEIASYDHSSHQCLMYDVQPSVLVVTDFQPAVEAVLLLKRHYEIRPHAILACGQRIGTVMIERASATEVFVEQDVVSGPGYTARSTEKIIVDVSASNDDVFKTCEAECNSLPQCHGVTVQFTTGLCKLYAGLPVFESASALYSNMWSGIKKTHIEEEIMVEHPATTTTVVSEHVWN